MRMSKVLLSGSALFLLAGVLSAEAQEAAIRGCNYAGHDGCRYVRTQKGEVYSLVATSQRRLPPANRVVIVTGSPQPIVTGSGVCSLAQQSLTTASIRPTGQKCKGPPR
jgi:hypothetical protein